MEGKSSFSGCLISSSTFPFRKSMAIEKKKREVHVKADKYYPPLAEQYQLGDEIGAGVSAVVYKAKCLDTNETVAIKSIDLEKEDIDLVKVRQEAQTLMLISHPNVLSAHCVFAAKKCLWVVMPFMAAGSLHNILRTSYPNGFKEEVIATMLKDVVNGLAYLHRAGHIHRDVKAGNILLDGDGTAKLADFGACVSVFDSNKRQPSSLAGSVLWMAPEIMFSRGYDFKADIWSFGITAMELAYGDTPFSGRKPHQIMEELENGIVPRLTSCKFSKSFRKMVGACVVMRPQKRPSAQKLVEHSFFKHYCKTPEFIVEKLLTGLQPVEIRATIMKEDRSRRIIDFREF